MKQYKREVVDRWSFRTANTKEYTHCYHAYPAMMIPQVARCLIEEFKPTGRCEVLFDPYCGSGTSLVEASLKGMNSIGTDLNPLARLISRVKTTRYEEEKINTIFLILQDQMARYDETLVIARNFDRISNASYWYTEQILLKLSYLSQLIDKLAGECADFFKVALSEVVRESSFTRNGEFKRFRMTEAQIRVFNPDVFKLFEEKVLRNIKGLMEFNRAVKKCRVSICDFNSSSTIPEQILPKGTVDMVVTSPPYGDSRTTVAYGQFSRWSNEWFEFEYARNLDNILMGGGKCSEERFETESIQAELEQIKQRDQGRYSEVVAFLNDYWASIQHVAPTIRRGGVVCYVVGNRNVKGVQIPLDYFTAEMFEKMGFEHETTIVREIPNKRMPSKTSPTNQKGVKVGTMKNEYIVIMKKRD